MALGNAVTDKLGQMAYGYVKANAGALTSQAARLLLPKLSGSQLRPAAALKGTALRSYMDATYEKKCGVEIKQNDLIGSGTLTTTLANYLNPYTAIAQGLTDTNRLGNSIEVKRCTMTFDFYAGAASTTATIVRFIVVKQGKMPGAVVPITDILQFSGDIRSPKALNNDQSYTVLKDVTFKLASLTGGETDSFKRIKWTYKPKKCHRLVYIQTGATGGITEMIQGNVSVYALYQGATAPTFDYYSRAEYADI